MSGTSPASRPRPTVRVAAIDCGTNSIRLLVADVTGTALSDVDRRMEIVRLGEGVDRTGRLAPEALARTMAALRRYADIASSAGASVVRMVATSATRDAANSAEFVRGVKEIIGIAPDVLTGDEEARLSFLGATAELASPDRPPAELAIPDQPAPTDRPASPDRPPAELAERTSPAERTGGQPYLVADIGGGSTEFVLGDASGLSGAISVNIGCVRMTERRLASDPPSDSEIAAATADIDAALDAVAADIPGAGAARTLVGLAGSVTTVAGIALGLDAYDSARIHHSVIPAGQVHQIAGALLSQTRAERALIPVMHPGRVDVIGAGALILDRIMTRFGFSEVLVSEHDILDGIALTAPAASPAN